MEPLPIPRSDCERSDDELPERELPDWLLAERDPVEPLELEPELLCMPG
ncbi:MAG TPA: hypothetical protein VJU87_06475 [Gemmatimonadaceae bacterium]|nr:hypothetical protein [Gemmatimonadaceae bacterium]